VHNRALAGAFQRHGVDGFIAQFAIIWATFVGVFGRPGGWFCAFLYGVFGAVFRAFSVPAPSQAGVPGLASPPLSESTQKNI